VQGVRCRVQGAGCRVQGAGNLQNSGICEAMGRLPDCAGVEMSTSVSMFFTCLTLHS